MKEICTIINLCIILHYLWSYKFLICTYVDELAAQLKLLILYLRQHGVEVHQQNPPYSSITSLPWMKVAISIGVPGKFVQVDIDLGVATINPRLSSLQKQVWIQPWSWHALADCTLSVTSYAVVQVGLGSVNSSPRQLMCCFMECTSIAMQIPIAIAIQWLDPNQHIDDN